jgi:hypothetical protein
LKSRTARRAAAFGGAKGILEFNFSLRSNSTVQCKDYQRPQTGRRICLEIEIMPRLRSKRLVVCINNKGSSTALERRKIYLALRDPAAEKHGLIRVVDESGDDYLYPRSFFRRIALPNAIRKALLAAA